MPKVLRDEIKVHIIQSRDHILNTYAEKISEYAEVSALRRLLLVEIEGPELTRFRLFRNASAGTRST